MDFLKKLKTGASSNDEACCIDVEILSRFLEAKLIVCCCSLSRDKELGEGSDSTEVCNRESFGQNLPSLKFKKSDISMKGDRAFGAYVVPVLQSSGMPMPFIVSV